MLRYTYIACLLTIILCTFNTLNAELNPICHLLALLGAHHILHVSRIRVKLLYNKQKAILLAV